MSLLDVRATPEGRLVVHKEDGGQLWIELHPDRFDSNVTLSLPTGISLDDVSRGVWQYWTYAGETARGEVVLIPSADRPQ